MEFALGDLIWIYPHEELSWAPGKIVSIEDSTYIVKAFLCSSDDSLYSIEKESALPVHPSCLQGVSNLLDLGEFNEASLLSNIRVRFEKEEIYTSIGEPLLISINPYKSLPIYSQHFKDQFKDLNSKESSSPPHLYKLGQNTLKNLRESNQSIIISGESGSGKTEAGKILLDFLAGHNKSRVSSRVLDSNPVLESFGNAKTLKNDNSSRFGKFIELHFDYFDLSLLTAKIQVYLLEKSRIVFQADGERNYHIFYQLCCGASETDKDKYKILPPDEYFYLIQGECIEIEGVDDKEAYKQTMKCLKNLGFSADDIDWIKRIIMGILYLGNIEFVGEDKAFIEQPEDFQCCCELLGLGIEEFSKVLLTRVIVDPSNKQEIVIPQRPEQSVNTRDATAKAIYNDLFCWIVEKINSNLFKKVNKMTRVIGILDIYGFEVFDENSFEQFCINYANEKLQQYFNWHMFKLEQSEYSQEQIHWNHIHYEDNQECLDLIESQNGLISILDEQTKLSKSTDKLFLSKIYSKVTNGKLSNPGVFKNEFFGIDHYAGTVFYNVAGFLDKNRDSLNPSLQSLLESSPLNFLYTNQVKKKIYSSISAVSVSSQFKSQLHDLIKTLSSANPVFVRCIKPNNAKNPMDFDSVEVKNQLRCAGLLECIRIRKSGYSIRRNFEEFIKKFGVLGGSSEEFRERCEEILRIVGENERAKKLLEIDRWSFQVGVSKVFMKDEFRNVLELEYSRAVKRFAVKVQKVVKGWFFLKKFRKVKKAVEIIQKTWRKKHEKIDEKRDKIDEKGEETGEKGEKNDEIDEKSGKSIKSDENFEKTDKVIKKTADVDTEKHVKKLKKVEKNEGMQEKRKPENHPTEDKLQESKFSIPEIIKDDWEEKILPAKSRQKKSAAKDFAVGSSMIVESLHDEMKKVNITLIKEREKYKQQSDDLLHYKNSYESALETIKTLKSELESQNWLKPSAQPLLKQEKTKSLSREIASKNNEIQILNLKIQSLTQQLEEQQEILDEYKEKEVKWRKNLENEILKNNELLIKLQNPPNPEHSSEIPKDPQPASDLISLKRQNTSLLSEIEALKSFEYTSKKELQRLRDELDLKNQQITLLEYKSPQKAPEAKSNLSTLLEKKSEKINELHSVIESLKMDIGISQSKDKNYKAEIENLKKSNNEKQDTISRLENEINELNVQVQKANRKIMETESELRVVKNSATEEFGSKIEELKEELEDRNNELEISKDIYATLLDILKLKNTEIEVYKQGGKISLEIGREVNAIRLKEKDLLHR